MPNLEVEVPEAHVVSQDVQHAHHLGEDEDAMSSLVETHQKLVQQVELATPTNQSLHAQIHNEDFYHTVCMKTQTIFSLEGEGEHASTIA